MGNVEAGDLTVFMVRYVAVLGVLGLADDLALVARDDEPGRKLQDIQLKAGKRKS